jgi:hypothetical protein
LPVNHDDPSSTTTFSSQELAFLLDPRVLHLDLSSDPAEVLQSMFENGSKVDFFIVTTRELYSADDKAIVDPDDEAALNDMMEQIRAIGATPIYLDLSSSYSRGGIRRSMLDEMQIMMALADFLNLDQPTAMTQDRRDLCDATVEFADHMQTARDNGLRAMGIRAAEENTASSSLYLASPEYDPVLLMLEELGLPLLHVTDDDDGEEMTPIESLFHRCEEGQDLTKCNTTTDVVRYPVDVWLYDGRYVFAFRHHHSHRVVLS